MSRLCPAPSQPVLMALPDLALIMAASMAQYDLLHYDESLSTWESMRLTSALAAARHERFGCAPVRVSVTRS
jgi:hypothetical protein